MMTSPVVRLTLRGVLARKFRILLTILAVVSGVAFVSGAFILTDSVKSAINNLFVELRGEVDLEIRTEIAFGDSARAERDPVAVSLMKDVAAIDGVRLVEVNLLRQATIIKPDGEPLQTSGQHSVLVGTDQMGSMVARFLKEPFRPKLVKSLLTRRQQNALDMCWATPSRWLAQLAKVNSHLLVSPELGQLQVVEEQAFPLSTRSLRMSSWAATIKPTVSMSE